MSILAIIGLGQVLLFLVLLILKRNKKIKDYFLFIILLSIAGELYCRYLVLANPQSINNFILSLDLIYWALLGPATYLYIEFLIVKDRKLKWALMLFLIPLVIILIPFLDFLVQHKVVSEFNNFINSNKAYYLIITYIWEYISPLLFLICTIKLIVHKRNVKKYYSNTSKKDLKWTLYLTMGFLTYILLSYALTMLNSFEIINLPIPTSSVIIVVLFLYVLGIGIFAYHQNPVFSENTLKEINQFNLSLEKKEVDPIKKKYLKSGLDTSEAELIISNLKIQMEVHKIYLDYELTINQLAKEVDTSMHKLSQVINSEFNKNFYDFINTYRVEEFKNRLLMPKYKDYKIMAIAYDSGFNSKSAFYSAFNKTNNLSPSAYRKQLMSNDIKVYSN